MTRLPTTPFFSTLHDPRGTLPLHAHKLPYLSFVVRGSYAEAVGLRNFECASHDVRFHPAGEEHANTFGVAGASCLNIELGSDWAESLATMGPAAREPSLHDEASWIGLQLVRATSNTALSGPLVVESLVAELLDLTVAKDQRRRRAERRHTIERVVAIIDEHPTGALSLHALAGAVNLHATHLARSFRQVMGCTIGEHVRGRRVVRAQRELRRHPDWSISRVAAVAGFADHAHLTRTFRRMLRITPSQYRATLTD